MWYDPLQKFKKQRLSLFEQTNNVQDHLPLKFEDSLTPIPNYPLCTLGMLTAEAQWGIQKGIAFVVEDRYLLTCASNCYSHRHGWYSNITFTIDSNRKHGYDTYTVKNVFIPQKYKYSSVSNRKEFNYALLEIAGQPSLKDKYGFAEIKGKRQHFQGPAYEKNVFNNIQEIFMGGQLLQKYPSVCLSGTPILCESQQIIQASGLLIEESKSQFSILWFTINMKCQLCQYTIYQKTRYSLYGLKPEDLNTKFFTFHSGQSGQIVELANFEWNEQQFGQYFDSLPFKSISHLTINNNANSLSFGFLNRERLKNLKVLSIRKIEINSLGCRNIKAASLNNLRVLQLSQSSIGNEGWMYLSQGKWLCLQKLVIKNCEFMQEGLEYLCGTKFTNLNQLQLKDNKLDNESSQILEKMDYSYIQVLKVLDSLTITWEFLHFLKSPPWKNLKHLTLSGNHIGNKGCKILKESSLLFHMIFLCIKQAIKEGCHFDDIGVKWICKADLSQLKALNIARNKIGDRGCCQLSKANIPLLKNLKLAQSYLAFGKARVKGFKLLFKTGCKVERIIFSAVEIILFQFGKYNLYSKQKRHFEFMYTGKV